MNAFAQTDRFSKKRFAAVLKNEILSTRRTTLIALGIAYSIFIITLLANTLDMFSGEFSIGRTAYQLGELFPVTMFLSTTRRMQAVEPKLLSIKRLWPRR